MPGIEPMVPALQMDSLLLSHLGSPVAEPKIFRKISYSFCKRTSKPQKPGPNETVIPHIM